MLISIFELPNMRKLSFLVFILCILISLRNQKAEIKKRSSPSPTADSSWDSFPSVFLSPFSSYVDEERKEVGQYSNGSLEYDFYRDACPPAEKIVHRMVQDLYKVNFSVAPALLRLVFHDCFIEGCDASILLDAAPGIDSEKDSPPNDKLKGYDVIDKIKAETEKVCPGVVSCADIVALAAREAVVQAGGPFYPLFTGRRDGFHSFRDVATLELPSPNADLSETLASFASRGFDERETVTLLGAHSIGVIHCKFFQNRLYNFGRTNKPDPSLDTGFLNVLRSRCNNSNSSMAASPSPLATPLPSSAPSTSFDGSKSPSTAPSLSLSVSPSSSSEAEEMRGSPSSLEGPSPSSKDSISSPPSSAATPSASFIDSLLSSPEPGMNMAYEGRGVDFGTLYYQGLLLGKGILYADQQLMAGEETGIWVRAYASDISLFRRDFALAMMKLSDLRVLTGSTGQVRLRCSEAA